MNKKGRPITVERKEKICKQCHKKFILIYSDRSGIFCSKKCNTQFSRENSTHYRTKALALLPNECTYCEQKDKLIVHHLDSNFLNNDIENLQIVCTKCHAKIHKAEYLGNRFKIFKSNEIIRGIRMMLNGLRVNLKDENFRGTPERVLRSFYEIFEGQGADLKDKLKDIFSSSFPSEYNGLVIVDNMKVFSTCPHHLRDIEYVVDVGYISKNRALGLSKICRVVQLLARRLVLQESFTNDIAKIFMEYLGADGVMVVVKGKHNCMRMRGIEKPDSVTTTSSVMGTFRKDLGARQEFLSLVNHNR